MEHCYLKKIESICKIEKKNYKIWGFWNSSTNKISFGKNVLSAYRKDFDLTTHMSFLIKDDELLKKYDKMWKKVKNTT